ncbi:hypothetical protein [Anabaena sp. AL09]|uniref:hypothetical protein n=1 Tax=Anabaena sp. AL09 TaxID=1710891 RepID=UPI000A7D59F2|nr:hypothetical protein [Anabaena sp. AL09]
MLVGAKHLEDKLSVIAKNSSPNASPVQLSIVLQMLRPYSCQLSVAKEYFSPLPPAPCSLPLASCLLPLAPCLLPIPVAEYWNKQTQ